MNTTPAITPTSGQAANAKATAKISGSDVSNGVVLKDLNGNPIVSAGRASAIDPHSSPVFTGTGSLVRQKIGNTVAGVLNRVPNVGGVTDAAAARGTTGSEVDGRGVTSTIEQLSFGGTGNTWGNNNANSAAFAQLSTMAPLLSSGIGAGAGMMSALGGLGNIGFGSGGAQGSGGTGSGSGSNNSSNGSGGSPGVRPPDPSTNPNTQQANGNDNALDASAKAANQRDLLLENYKDKDSLKERFDKIDDKDGKKTEAWNQFSAVMDKEDSSKSDKEKAAETFIKAIEPEDVKTILKKDKEESTTS